MCQTRWWDLSGTWWKCSGTVSGSDCIVRRMCCSFREWNVRKCESGDTGILTLTICPLWQAAADQSIFQSFPQHPHPCLHPPHFDDADSPRSNPSAPYSAPDPTNPSVSLGGNQIHRTCLLLEKSSERQLLL